MSKRALIAAALMLAISAPLYAGFGEIESELRHRLGSPTYIPGMFLVRVITWVAHPKGVHDIRLTVFEEKKAHIDGAEFEKIVEREIPRGFRPMIKTRSARTGEWAFIYARPKGSDRIELCIVSHDNSDTVLIDVDIEPDVVMRELHNPHGIVASLR